MYVRIYYNGGFIIWTSSVWSEGAMKIDNSTVKTTCTGDYGYVTESLFSNDTLTIEGNSDVLIIGAIFGKNGVVISPTEGNKIDVKVGIKENGEEGTKHFKSSPYGETTTLDSYDLLGGYTYVHIKNHIHVYDQQSTDDRYKISGATCTEPAKYYKSCVCGEKGTETFEIGQAAGHKAEKTEVKAPTATEPGNIEYWYCPQCDTYFKDAELTEAITKEQTVLSPTGEPEEKPQTPPTDTQKSPDKIEKTIGSPQTGDDSNTALWIAVMLTVGAALTGTLLCTRKKKYNK